MKQKIETIVSDAYQNHEATELDLIPALKLILQMSDEVETLKMFQAIKDCWEVKPFEMDIDDEMARFSDRFFDHSDILALSEGADPMVYFAIKIPEVPYFTHSDEGNAVNLTIQQIHKSVQFLIDAIEIFYDLP